MENEELKTEVQKYRNEYGYRNINIKSGRKMNTIIAVSIEIILLWIGYELHWIRKNFEDKEK